MSGNPWQGPHIWQLALSDALAEQSVLEESQTKGLEQNCFPHSRPFPITQTRCPSSRSQQPTLSGFFLGGTRGVPPGPLPWWWVARKSFPLISLHLVWTKFSLPVGPIFVLLQLGITGCTSCGTGELLKAPFTHVPIYYYSAPRRRRGRTCSDRALVSSRDGHPFFFTIFSNIVA